MLVRVAHTRELGCKVTLNSTVEIVGVERYIVAIVIYWIVLELTDPVCNVTVYFVIITQCVV